MLLRNALRSGVLTIALCNTAGLTFAQKGMDLININGQLVIAARASNVDRVAKLLAEGASVNSRDRNGDSPLNTAASKGDVALVDVLLRANADANLANLSGVTPLMGATFSANVAIVRKLLAAKALIEPLDRVKKNAATYAAANGCTECLTEMLRAGTQVSVSLENDLTLLMWAAAYGHQDSVRMLLSAGADRSMKDKRGKTASEMAAEGGHTSVLAIFANP